MNNRNQVLETADQPNENQNQQSMMNYQFSNEELKVLQECNTESFFQRSLPLGTGLGVAAFLAVQKGYLKPSARFGAGPKVIAGVFLGYFAGKFSYQSKCAEKLMRIPNSRLAELLKQRKKGGLYENLAPDQGFGSGLSLAPFAPSGDHYSDEHLKESTQGSALDLDINRPANSGLDDVDRPSLDSTLSSLEENIQIETAKSATSYDDLRKKNREEFLKRQESPFNRPVSPEESPIVRRKPDYRNDENSADPKSKDTRKNKYGDVWT